MTSSPPGGAVYPTLRRTVAALACGWIVGIAVATLIELFDPLGGAVLTLRDEIMFSVVFGAFRGAIVIAICVPCWLALRRIGRNGWVEAIVLGYLATFVMQILLSVRTFAAPDYTERMLIPASFAVAGAAGGLVTWLVGYARRSPRSMR